MIYLLVIGVVALVVVVVGKVVQHKRDYPDLSLYIAMLNTAMIPLRLFGLGIFKHGDRINLEVAMKDAMKETGLSESSSSPFSFSLTHSPCLSLCLSSFYFFFFLR